MAKESLNSSNDDLRRELYERFRSELAEDDRRNLFYDEDDLIDIYDYATDYNDRFIALEVLFCAERLYPASIDFQERKALFYLTVDDEAAAGAIHRLPEDSVIRTLTALRIQHPSKDEIRSVFDALLRDHPEFTDEEIIQLCVTAEELDMLPWLVASKDAVKAHTDYPPTFLYELCQMIHPKEPEEALHILEELTMAEPFAIDFWLLMAQIHIEQGNPSKALPAIEYALAIEPDNVRALMSRAHAYNELKYPAEQVESALNDVKAVAPSLAAPNLALALVQLQDRGNPAGAMKILRDFNAVSPGDPQTLDIMLMAAERLPGETLPDIDTFLVNSPKESVEEFVEMARRHADESRHRAAAILLLGIDRVFHLTADFDFMMEELYRSGMYHEAFDSYQSHFKQDDGTVQITINELNDCFAAFWFLLTAIRLGVTEGLAPLVAALLASEPVNSSRNSIDYIFASRGLTDHLIKINAFLSGADNLDIDTLDPFKADARH